MIAASSVSSIEASTICLAQFGLRGQARPLPGEYDDNFLVETEDSNRFVLKIAHPARSQAWLDFENQALAHLHRRKNSLAGLAVPQPCPALDSRLLIGLPIAGETRWTRLLTWVPGIPAREIRYHAPSFLQQIGRAMASLDLALADFEHPQMSRRLLWDMTRADEIIAKRLDALVEVGVRRLVETALERTAPALPRLTGLRCQVIHNDGNEDNLLSNRSERSWQVSGLIDFGDMLHAPLVCEPAIAAAYAAFGKPDPLAAAADVAAGYQAVCPLTELEIALLYDLMLIRLAASLAIAAERRVQSPGNAYHQISAGPAKQTLKRLLAIHPNLAHYTFRQACGFEPHPEGRKIVDWLTSKRRSFSKFLDIPAGVFPPQQPDLQTLLADRRRTIGPSLSLSYRTPLHIVRGRGVWLYDADGRAYLDCVNNVAHVGHSHPAVVEAIAVQQRLLNTNTRYLHANLTRLAEKLTAHLPEALQVCYFVNSGSEANDLALRLAQAYTGRIDLLVLEGAYHGNLSSLVEISPYKFNGPGGQGAPAWVHVLALPDRYRGLLRGEPDPAAAYAAQAEAVIAMLTSGRGVCALIAEALPGTAGQIVIEPGWMARVYALVRQAGGVCIADEVQTGFGRMGSHYWGFETHEVTPDILTLGKPFGNGHPLGAVVTTAAIARALDNGMEYFNTFGGNPVSCAAGLAVLETIEREGLQQRALAVGNLLKAGLEGLQTRYGVIGDVRGRGLFLGVELVSDRETRQPAGDMAGHLVERMRERGVLLSTDGPGHNVLKIKPPLVFAENDAQRVVRELEEVLGEV